MCPLPASPTLFRRLKTTSVQYVAAWPIDHTFEKLMDSYKHLLKVLAASIPLPLLSTATPCLRLSHGDFPLFFSLLYEPSVAQPLIRLIPATSCIASDESSAASATGAADRLRRLLFMISSQSVPLRAVFGVWRELGVPDDFEDLVIARNPTIFMFRANPRERNTNQLELVKQSHTLNFTPAVEQWRVQERSRVELKQELKFAFKLGFCHERGR